MTPARNLLAFGLALGVTFAVGAAIGQAVGPIDVGGTHEPTPSNTVTSNSVDDIQTVEGDDGHQDH